MRASSLPFLLAAGYLFFVPVQVPTPAGIRLAPSDLFVVLYCGLLAMQIRQPAGSWSPWHLALPLVLLVGLLVALISEGFVTAYAAGQKVLGIFVLLATYAMFVDIGRGTNAIPRVLRILIAVTAAHAVVAIMALALQRWGLLSTGVLNFAGIRLAGFLVDPNAFGGLLALALAVHLTLQGTGARLFDSRTGGLITFVLSAGLLLTFSRSAWLGFSLALACWAVVWRRAIASFLAAGAAAAVLFVGAAGTGALNFVRAMAWRPDQVTSRVELLQEALDMFIANPLLGAGTGVFLETHDAIVHNTAFWLLAETGLLGLVAFAGFAIWFVQRGVSAYRHEEGCSRQLVLALLLGHIVMIGVSFGIEALYQRHWWVVLALLGAATSRRGRASDGGVVA